MERMWPLRKAKVVSIYLNIYDIPSRMDVKSCDTKYTKIINLTLTSIGSQ